ncbi:MAG: carboxypeptidase-like regulatory domain-containing protein, partial [Clostridium sp.]
MVLIRKDKHVLGQSENKQLASTGSSAKADIQLQAATVTIGATIHGTIRDAGNNAVIPGALVELMDGGYNPVQYTLTNADGFYAFPNIPSATYTIFVTVPGKKLAQGATIVANSGQIFIRDINVDADPALLLGVITGQVKNTSGTTIPGAVVYLYKVVSGVETLVSLTGSSDEGQFIFREVDLASYKIVVTGLGYTDNSVTTTVATAGQIVTTTVTLSGSGSAGIGTISGVITNSTGVAVNRADAILQRVEADGSLTPLAFTKTNTNGVYLFSGVPTGTFKVVSNEVEVLDITVPALSTRPNVDKITLSQAITVVPITYSVADAVFTNNARKVGANNDFAGYIGGPENGTATNTLTVLTYGTYTFGFERVNSAGARPVKISVNGG